MMPAVVIGGPPHSGKSVLTYSLTAALRARDVPHYVIRAYPPDCEGDWFFEADRTLVRHLRVKGARGEAWLPLLRADIARRHLPLIVDMGGLPTSAQEALLDDCTHGILLTPDAEGHDTWRACFARHDLDVLADLHSELHGHSVLTATEPVLRGTLAGLDRQRCAEGVVVDALVARLAQLFLRHAVGLPRRHLVDAPVELAVDLEQLAAHLGTDPQAWQPGDLSEVLDYLPEARPLGLYGRGPNWLYAAVAALAQPEAFVLFDVRLGWVQAPALRKGTPDEAAPLQVRRHPLAAGLLLDFHLPDAYLDISEVDTLRVPEVGDTGLILSGKLPLWLWAGLARAYAVPWLAVWQPHLSGAVVIATRTPAHAIGDLLPIPGGF